MGAVRNATVADIHVTAVMMLLADIKVGMRLRPSPEFGGFGANGDRYIATVTSGDATGFTYSFDKPLPFHPRLGIVFAQNGHVAYAIDGRVHWMPSGERRRWRDTLRSPIFWRAFWDALTLKNLFRSR